MKVAYVYDTIFPYTKGGVEKRLWELSTRLVKRGHEIHIFGPQFWEGPSVFMKEGVYLHGVCRAPRKRFVQSRRSIGGPLYFSWKVLGPLLRQKFDVIDCQNFPYFPCFSAKMASVVRRTPLVISWYEVWNNYWYRYLGRRGIFGKVIERVTGKLPHQIIVETECNRRALAAWGYDPQKIALIPSGVSYEWIQSVPPAPEVFDVIFVGRLIRAKGVYTFVEMVAHLVQHGQRIKAAIVGDGPEMEGLVSCARQMGVADTITFFGHIEDDARVVSLVRSAKVFVYAAVPEGGWSLSIVEANACGVPVVSVGSGDLGVNEAVVHGSNGLLATEASPSLLGGMVARLLQDARLYEELSQGALARAQRLNWENQAQAVEGVWLGLARRA